MYNFKCLSTFPLKSNNFIEPGPPRGILSLQTKPLGHEPQSVPVYQKENRFHKSLGVLLLHWNHKTVLFWKIIFTSYINREHESTDCIRKLSYLFLSWNIMHTHYFKIILLDKVSCSWSQMTKYCCDLIPFLFQWLIKKIIIMYLFLNGG